LTPWKVVSLPSGIEPLEYLKSFDLSEDEEAYLFIDDEPKNVRVADSSFSIDEIDAKMAYFGSPPICSFDR